jgi:hypothetical protein
MISSIRSTEHRLKLVAVATLTLLTGSVVFAQAPATLGGSTTDTEWQSLTAAELDVLVGPIALYPDDLVAIVLPASTFPLQIVQASRYLETLEEDATSEPDPDWDESVVALLNYPEVLTLLNDDLDWTWELGEAVIYQQGDVLNSIQSFRDQAYAAGNLATDERQVVAAADEGVITIKPADPEVIYVPYYDPARVVVRQYVPAYHYYPYAYPAYYYPYPAGYSFSSGLFWGVTSAFLVSWPDHYLHVHHHSHFGHPYYGYSYYTPWYARTNYYVNVNLIGGHHRWAPGYGRGGRPQHHAGFARVRDRAFAEPRYDGRRRPAGLQPRARDQRGANYGQRGNTSQPQVDERRQRRLRTGEPQRDANITARQNTARQNNGASRELGERYRRPRSTDTTATRSADGRTARTRPGTVQARPDTRGVPQTRDRNVRVENRGTGIAGGRTGRSGDLNTNTGRAAPPRGASPAARGSQGEAPRARAMPNSETGTSRGRLAPAPRNPVNAGMNNRAQRAYGRAAPAQRAPNPVRSNTNARQQPAVARMPAQGQQRLAPAPVRANPGNNGMRTQRQAQPSPAAPPQQQDRRGRFARK